MTIAPMNVAIDIDTNRSNRPPYIETIVINRQNPSMYNPTALDLWVSLAFDGLNATLSAGEGTHNPLAPLYITGYGARQLAGALNRLADRIDAEGNSL